MSWDLIELKKHVRSSQGKSISHSLSQYLDSIVERQEFVRYHYHEAKYLLSSYFDDSVNERDFLEKTFFSSGESREEFEDNRFKAKANLASSVQSLQSISDILSHVIYYSLGLSTLKERDINLNRVTQSLKNTSNYLQLHTLVTELKSHNDYEYLNALVNHSKHRSLINADMRLNLQKAGLEMKELVFPTFEYNEKTYPEKPALKFLQNEFDRQSKLIVIIGNELNRITAEITA